MAGQNKTRTLYNGEKIRIDDDRWDFARYQARYNNASAAYVKVYGDNKNKRQLAHLKMQQSPVIKAVEHFRHKIEKALDISEARILAELAAVGLARPTDVVDDEGKPINPADLDETTKRALAGMEIEEAPDGTIKHKYRFNQKVQALKTIAEIKGLGKISEGKKVNVKIVHKS